MFSKSTLGLSKSLKKGGYSTKGSLSVGEGTAPLLKTTYHKLFLEQIASYPHKNFFTSVREGIRWTYKEALYQNDALASGLAESGGPLIASALPLRSEALMTQIATGRSQKRFSPIEPASGPDSVLEKIKSLNPGTLIYPAKVGKKLQLDEIYEVFPYFERSIPGYRINDNRFSNLRHVIHVSKTDLKGMTSFKDVLVYANKSAIDRLEQNPLLPNTIVFSNNKRVNLSQHNILNTGYFVGKIAGVTEEDIVLTTLQLHRSAGLSLGVGLSLSHKCTLVYGSDTFNLNDIKSSIVDEYITTLVAQPSEVEQLLNDNAYMTKVTKIIIASSPENRVTQSILDRLREKKVTTVVTFGTNESSGVLSIAVNPTNAADIGRALPHTEVSIVDATHKVVPVETQGTLRVKGFNVASIDHNNESSVPFEKNGELYTGIRARMNQSGNILLTE